MPRRNVGDRVGAVSHNEGDTIYIFGYGTYAGDEVPETAGGWMADGLREYKVPNPKLVLDNGQVVWGCECWWGSEEAIQKQAAAYKNVVEINIEESRKNAEQSNNDSESGTV